MGQLPENARSELSVVSSVEIAYSGEYTGGHGDTTFHNRLFPNLKPYIVSLVVHKYVMAIELYNAYTQLN